jgi:hypothetical protein
MLRPSRATRALTQAAAVMAVLLVPAAAQAAYAVPTTPCPATPSAGKVFAAWGDNSQYVPVTGGTFAGASTGWALSGGAAVVSGGSPFWGGSHSLGLPTGASATSASLCIGSGYPTFRFTARNTGAATSTLQVEVLYLDGAKKASKVVGKLSAGSSWNATKQLSVVLGQTGVNGTDALTPVAFRFTPLGAGGSWRIDDLYVDPYQRG